ncbi:hypothetical protein JZU56_04515, partial [bacterium]|nr:hypothetical protein [bacterium]
IDEKPSYRRSSSGSSLFFFTPQPEKTFNRGRTDYFVNDRKVDIGAFESPKFVGEAIGKVTRLGRDSFDVTSKAPLHNGDGLSYFDSEQDLVGLRINRAEKSGVGYRLFPTLSNGKLPSDLLLGSAIFRNRDQEFERLLEKKSAERYIPVSIRLEESTDGFALHMTDAEGISVLTPPHLRQGTRPKQRTSDEHPARPSGQTGGHGLHGQNDRHRTL